jgi:hypothetical protein
MIENSLLALFSGFDVPMYAYHPEEKGFYPDDCPATQGGSSWRPTQNEVNLFCLFSSVQSANFARCFFCNKKIAGSFFLRLPFYRKVRGTFCLYFAKIFPKIQIILFQTNN